MRWTLAYIIWKVLCILLVCWQQAQPRGAGKTAHSGKCWPSSLARLRNGIWTYSRADLAHASNTYPHTRNPVSMPSQQDLLWRDVNLLGQQYSVVLVGFKPLDGPHDCLKAECRLRDVAEEAIPVVQTVLRDSLQKHRPRSSCQHSSLAQPW